MTTYKRVTAVKNAVKIVDHIVESKTGMRGLDVAKLTGMNPSTCYSILHTLCDLGVISYDERKKTFSEGVWLYEKYKKSSLKFKAIPGLSALFESLVAEHPSGVCTLWKIFDNRCVLVEKLAGKESRSIRLSVGQRMPRYLGAFGRALAAVDSISLSSVEEVIATVAFEERPTADEFYADMRFFLKYGYSADCGRYVSGITAVSTLLIGADEEPVYAVSFITESAALEEGAVARIGQRLRDFAKLF